MRYNRDGFSVEAARKKKRKLPDDHWFNHEPPEVPGDAFFHEAYRDLVSCRTPDGPIPWTAVMAYADRKGLEPDIAEALWIVISKMDYAERKWQVDNIREGKGD